VVGVLCGGYEQDERVTIRFYQDPFDLLNHVDELGVRAVL
jgi:hypothetical protein